MATIVDVLVAPGKAFRELRDKPTWLLPFLLVAVAAFCFMWLYFSKVDLAWYVGHALAQAGRDPGAAQHAPAPNGGFLRIAGSVTAMLKPALAALLYAVYFTLAARLLGKDLGFRRGLSLASWSRFPLFVGLLVAIVGAASMAPATSYESLRYTYLDPLVLHVPADSAWAAFARSVNLLTFWQIALAAIGWRSWTRSGWGQATLVAVLPMACAWLAGSIPALAAG